MSKNKVTIFILNAIKPFKWWIAGQFLVAVILAVNVWFRPYLLKIMIDRMSCVVPGAAYQLLIVPALGYVLIALVSVIIHRFYDYIWINFHEPCKRYIGQILMDRMMLHAHQLYQNQFAGDLATKIKDVMSGVPDLVRTIIDKFFGHILTIIIAITAIAVVSTQIAAMLTVWVIIFTAGSIFFSRRAQPLFHKAAQKRSYVIGTFVDILSNMMSVRLYTARDNEHKNVHYVLTEYINADIKRDWYLLKIYAFQGLSFVLYQMVCLYVLIQGFRYGTIQSGDFVLILSINISLVENLWSLSRDFGKFAESVGDVTQGLSIALSKLEVKDAPHAQILKVTEGKIVFDSVSFFYPESESLFENKSVTIAAHQKVGLVGYSGSGKTTFANLILRLYDIQSGHIYIDGFDIAKVTQDSLRAAISMIPQEPILFHRTIMENIRYGNPQATDQEVIQASIQAHTHEFISKLPEGYQTMMGERGVKISGGQRQRIAIARAILKNAPILILDEATSQLDSIIEGDVQESLGKLMQGKTTLVIAHRLSTLSNMDRILVFDNGVIVQDGTHKELVHQEGLYKQLCDAQIGGFIQDVSDVIEA
ncbi:MAG: ABC transporter ATP-binding protein [Candidatus Babeliales bacterium]|nr:ABC transporter ATP-binding protein [Candidatus Babeliales bacterium]